jgi:hypothetical protein
LQGLCKATQQKKVEKKKEYGRITEKAHRFGALGPRQIDQIQLGFPDFGRPNALCLDVHRENAVRATTDVIVGRLTDHTICVTLGV